MARLRNNILIFFVTILSFVFYGPQPAFAADNTNANWLGTGSRWNTTEWKIYTSNDGTPQDLVPGANNVNAVGTSAIGISTANVNMIRFVGAISSTTVSAQTFGLLYTGFLVAGTSAAVEGSVLCSTNQTVGQGITLAVCGSLQGSGGTPAGNLAYTGVAAAAASTGAAVNFYAYGIVNVLSTGTILPGDLLVTSTMSAGYVQTVTSTAISSNTIGIALANASLGGSGGNLVKVKLR